MNTGEHLSDTGKGPSAVRQDETRAHWDQQAAGYDAGKQHSEYYYETLKTMCRRLLPTSETMRILEIGCGTGEILASLRPREGVGVDISERMIAIAKEKHADSRALRFQVAAAEQLPANMEPFDAVIMCDVLEHVADASLALAAPLGAIAPGGVFLVSTSNPLWAFPLWVLEKLHMKMPEGPHCWVPLHFIRNRLVASGCGIVAAGYQTLIPLRIPCVTRLVNEQVAEWPGFRRLGLTQFVMARPDRPRPL